MYNTKLTREQKAQRKQMKADFLLGGGELFSYQGLTVALEPVFKGSNMARMAVSVAAPDELKQRRKVGEYHALMQMNWGTDTQMPVMAGEFQDFADNLAEILGFEMLEFKGMFD